MNQIQISNDNCEGQAAVLEKLHLLLRAFEASSCGITISDMGQVDEPLIYVNQAFEQMTGHASEEVVGVNCRFLQADLRDQVGVHEVRSAIRAERNCRVVLRNVKKDGTPFWNDLNLAPVTDGSGRLTHYIGIQTDISAQREAEDALVRLNEELEEKVRERTKDIVEAYDQTLQGWVKALEIRDYETEGHSKRVTTLTKELAHSFGIAGDEALAMERGALLHDIGKIGVPDNVLLKPGRLTPEEREVIERHPSYAHDWLSPISYLGSALDIPYCHHEKWDGSGYPRGLAGEDIPLAARIFAIVDVWDALTSDRPYRSRWPAERVMEHLRSLSGSHFDPAVVDAFLRLPSIRVDSIEELSLAA